MNVINFAEYRARRLVDRLFEENSTRYGQACEWPVLGGNYLSGVDPVEEMKERAVRALLAREWFSRNGPPDAPPLPLSHDEREALKHGGIDHIWALFARSLDRQGYDWQKHPSFYDYACGAMALRCLPRDVQNDPELTKRFPARPLEGLTKAALCWSPTVCRKRAA